MARRTRRARRSSGQGVRRFGALENATGIDAAWRKAGNVGAIAHQSADFGKFSAGVDRGKPMLARGLDRNRPIWSLHSLRVRPRYPPSSAPCQPARRQRRHHPPRLHRPLVGLIIFCAIVHGIATVPEAKKVGRVAIKALIYFEVVTTFALVIGLSMINLLGPGRGMNVDPHLLSGAGLDQYVHTAQEISGSGFLLHLVPHTIVSAFTEGNVLQVVFISVLFAFGLAPRSRSFSRSSATSCGWRRSARWARSDSRSHASV